MTASGPDSRMKQIFRAKDGVKFDGGTFLATLADAYNARDAVRLCSFFALDDPRFCIFEEFSGELLYGDDYRRILSLAEESTGVMSFEELSCSLYGEYALLHAIQWIREKGSGKGSEEAGIRATLFISLGERVPRILSGHFSSLMLCFPKRETAIRWRSRG